MALSSNEGRKTLLLLKELSPFHFDVRKSEPRVPEEVHRSMQHAVTEGALAGISAAMTGGVVLVGFALSLGANEFIIGLIAAIQSGANLLQMRGYRLLETWRERKAMAVRFAAISRLIWIPICALVFLNVPWFTPSRIWLFLLLFTVSAGLGVTSAVAWVSWLVDLVPQGVRGRFFAQRNIATGAVGMLLGIAAGKFVDLWKEHSVAPEPYAFVVLVMLGLIFGFWAVAVQKKMYDPPFPKSQGESTFWESLKTPLNDPTFRRIFFFRIFYDVSLHSAGTFYSVYMLTQVGLSFTFVSALLTMTMLTNLLSLKFWGKMLDRYGNKPVLYICLIGKLLFAALWLLTTPETFLLYVIIHAFGVFDAGNNIAIPNLIYKIAPAERRANYITVDGTLVGIAATVAPLMGGALAVVFSGWSVSFGAMEWGHFHFLFLVSIILRIGTFYFLRRVQEPEAAPLTEVISILRPIRSIDVYEGFETALNVVVAPARFVLKKLTRKESSKLKEKKKK